MYFGESYQCFFSQVPNISRLMILEEVFIEYVLSCFDIVWLHRIGRLINRNINQFICNGLRNYELKFPDFKDKSDFVDSPYVSYANEYESVSLKSFMNCLRLGYFSGASSIVLREKDVRVLLLMEDSSNFTNLKTVSMTHIDDATFSHSMRLFKNCKGITSLVFDDCDFKDQFVQTLNNDIFKDVTSLEINKSIISDLDDGINEEISLLKQLEKVTITQCYPQKHHFWMGMDNSSQIWLFNFQTFKSFHIF